MEGVLNKVNHVAIYLRRSRGEEEKDLEKHQLNAIELCEKEGWSYEIYKEIGSGDSIDGRPEMLKLLDAIEGNQYDAVVVSYYNRLGRGTGTDQDRITNTFFLSNTLIVELYPFNIIDPTDEASEELLAFKQFMARREYKSINKNMQNGRKTAIKMGRWVFSNTPYGYKYNKETKKLDIDEEQSKVYKMIVDWYLSGDYSTNDIVWELNKRKILSPKGSLWNNTSLLFIMKSEVYLGHIVHNKKKQNPITKEIQYLPKSEWRKVHNAHPALISQSDFDLLQEKIKNNRKRTGKSNTNTLSGIVKCFNCHSTLPIMKDKDGHDVISKCYNCGKCRGGQTDLVIHTIYETLSVIKEQIHRLNESDMANKEKSILLKEIEKFDKKLQTHEQALENIEKAMEDGLYSYEKAKKKMEERNEAIYEINSILKKKREQLNSFSAMTNGDRIKQIEKFYEDMKNSKGDSFKENNVIKSIISHVSWKRDEWDEVEIAVNFL